MVSNKTLTLKKRSEFTSLKTQGTRKFFGDWLIVNYSFNNLDQCRFGWTIPKYVGNAIVRNKFRRWFREFFRHRSFQQNLDVNLILKKKSKDFYKALSYEEFEQVLLAFHRKLS